MFHGSWTGPLAIVFLPDVCSARLPPIGYFLDISMNDEYFLDWSKSATNVRNEDQSLYDRFQRPSAFIWKIKLAALR